MKANAGVAELLKPWSSHCLYDLYSSPWLSPCWSGIGWKPVNLRISLYGMPPGTVMTYLSVFWIKRWCSRSWALSGIKEGRCVFSVTMPLNSVRQVRIAIKARSALLVLVCTAWPWHRIESNRFSFSSGLFLSSTYTLYIDNLGRATPPGAAAKPDAVLLASVYMKAASGIQNWVSV